jgi:small subunit ribosomal protein S20e
MADTDKGKGKDTEDLRKVKVRIIHSSKDLKALEKVTNSLIENAKKKEADGVTIRGPTRMPTKTLRITCRKTPCGEGSKTWDRWELRIYKVHNTL